MKARENPFSTSRVLKLRYRLTETEWGRLLDRLAGLRYRAALVGWHGSGKTTLLEDLQPRLETLGFHPHWLRLNRSKRALPSGFLTDLLPSWGARDILLCDGAEQLPWWTWLRLKRDSRSIGGLIITIHRPGKLPTLRECQTNPALLASLVNELAGGPGNFDAKQAAELLRQHQGNIRDVLRKLYDRWARLPPSDSCDS